jgi:hypothetical protein
MRNVVRSVALVTAGVAGGFALAHLVNSTESGRAFFGRVNEFTAEFADAVKQGYEARTEAIYAAIEANEK